jgi:acetolactate synthase-1/2/3 large subunit
MQQAVRTGGEIVAEMLGAAGVDTVFGVLSVHNIPIYDALDRVGGFHVVNARGEQGAASMADGYARVTGRLGVVITSTGVGAANAAGPLLEAYNASSPVLHITGQIDSRFLADRLPALHAAKDQLSTLQSIGKAAFRAATTEEVAETMWQAIALAQSGRPGPVSVEIPIDQQYRAVPTEPIQMSLVGRTTPPEELAAHATSVLASARRPLIWAGGGVIQSDAAPELTALAERLGAGVITSAAGRGAIPENHHLCLGNFSSEVGVVTLLQRADVLLAVGTQFRGNETQNWQLGLPPQLIRIDAEAHELGRGYRPSLGIAGDAKLTLQRILDALSGPSELDPTWQQDIEDVRAAARARWRAMLGSYEQIMDELRAALPQDAIVVRDVTVPATAWGSRLLEVYQPRTALHSASLAIGQGLAMAIGAGVGQPDRPVVLLAGDGGFAMSLGELGTAQQEQLLLTVVLFDDAGYGILRNLQDAHFERRHFAVDLDSPNWTELGRAFGFWTGQVSSAAEFKGQLAEALGQSSPALLALNMASIGPMAVPFTGVARLVPAGR